MITGRFLSPLGLMLATTVLLASTCCSPSPKAPKPASGLATGTQAGDLHWKPISKDRMGPHPAFEFTWVDGDCRIDSRDGTYTKWMDDAHPAVARIRFSQSERDSIRDKLLGTGFFDWPSGLGTPHPTGIPGMPDDEVRLTAVAGILSADVTRHDRFGRDEDALDIREAKASMSDIGDLIRGIGDAKPEVRRLPERPAHAL